MSTLARLGFVSSLSFHGALFAAAVGATSSPPSYGVATGKGAIEVALVRGKAPAARVKVKDHGLPILPPKEEVESEETEHQAGEAGTEAAASGAGALTEAHPNYLRNPPPAYPELSRRRREQGVVLLLVSVSAEGTVRDISISRSSGYPRLDEAALKSVRGWEFQPAMVRGLNVDSRVEVPVRFQLES